MKRIRKHSLVVVFFLIIYICCGCSRETAVMTGSQQLSEYQSGQTQVLIPESPGQITVESGSVSFDFSKTNQGYFTGLLSAPDTRINIQVTGPDQVVYQYFINETDTCTVFPLTAGSGTYLIFAFQQISGDQYAALLSHTVEVTLDHDFLPFLYPNQYVNFSADSEAIQLAAELSAEAEEDLEALKLIYSYITSHIAYDEQKAKTVETGYLPDIDETLRTGTGICFDYAALTAAMLRSLSIPTRLEIGYSNEVRHAWIDVYIRSMGWIDNAIEFNGGDWNLLDPTFAASAQDAEIVKDYLGDGSNYTLQYIR